MTIYSSAKSCIAWFKLAEFVEKKEKEKALVLYRLLARSINNNAFGLHLLGTLHQSFNNYEEACNNLILTLDIYYQDNPEMVITIYEKIILQNKKQINTEHLEALAKYYLKYYDQNKDLLNFRVINFLDNFQAEQVNIILSNLSKIIVDLDKNINLIKL